VQCVQCAKAQSKIACEDCGESYCEECFHLLHFKGNRLKHRSRKVPNCFACGFQTASRFCFTCQRIGEDKELLHGEVGAGGKGVGNFCDHCFGVAHPTLKARAPEKTVCDWSIVGMKMAKGEGMKVERENNLNSQHGTVQSLIIVETLSFYFFCAIFEQNDPL